jgi:hypothetical protein
MNVKYLATLAIATILSINVYATSAHASQPTNAGSEKFNRSCLFCLGAIFLKDVLGFRTSSTSANESERCCQRNTFQF